MTVRTAAQLKAEFQSVDPQNFADDLADTFSAAASATAAGIVELATTAEASAGTDTERAVTPAGLASAVPAASATAAGKVELATDTEAKVGTDTARAVTPANLAAVLANCKIGSFGGHDGAGACTLTGAAVGDRVIGVAGLSSGALGIADASFETTITVINEIQQSAAGNLSANDYLAILQPAA